MFTRNEIGAKLSRPSSVRHPWWELEEFKPDGGMWAIPKNTMRQFYADRAAELMADPQMFHEAMLRAVKLWPNSCDTAFATPGLNLRAWLGHAGCFIATHSPEEATRIGWHQLDPGEQWAANAAADQAIAVWRELNKPDAAQDMLWGDDYA